MLVEFLGVPGVGKTTLADGLALELRRQGYDVRFLPIDQSICGNRYGTLAYHLACVARWSLGRPRQAWRSASLLRLFPQPTLSMGIRILRYWLYTHAFAAAESKRSAVAILDQGFYQGIFSWALLSRDGHARIGAALARIPTPDVLVVVTAPPQEIEVRLAQRPYSFSRLQGLLKPEPGWLDRATRLVDLIAQAAHGGTGCAVIEHLSAPGLSIGDASRAISEEVIRCLARTGGARRRFGPSLVYRP